MKAKGYSLWLVPEGKAGERLSTLIAGLSEQHGTPLFNPHVTLLAGLSGERKELVRICEDFTRLLHPLDVDLAEPGWLNEYFKCLFLHVDSTPPLIEAHKRASAAFGRDVDAGWMPHLSLIYGDLPEDAKAKIAARLERGKDLSFRATKLHLFSTEGDPSAWRQVAEFPLG